MNPENDPVTYILIAIIILFFATLFLVAIVSRLYDFSRELDFINREIKRTAGGEQRYWKREKRRLWLSLLPFYRG